MTEGQALKDFLVALQELKLGHHNPGTRLFAVYPYHGNLS